MENQELEPQETQNEPILAQNMERSDIPNPFGTEGVNLRKEGDENRWSQNRLDLSRVGNAIESVKKELAKVIIGQTDMMDLLIVAILCDGHVLIEGVPGIAKTMTAKLLAKTIQADFSRIQFTPDLMPTDVVGTMVFNMQTSQFYFNSGPVFANIVLIDEINRAPAKTQSSLFEVMEERQVTIDGKTYPMGFPFLVMATQNPIEQEGTYKLHGISKFERRKGNFKAI
jgi:MoxR-like ATPase